jgi:PAS domain S-box-containing protein
MQTLDADYRLDTQLRRGGTGARTGNAGKGTQPMSQANRQHSGPETGVEDPIKPRAGILVADPIHRRLIEAAFTHLELAAEILDESEVERSMLASFEVLIADQPVARRLRQKIAAAEQEERVHPALIAVVGRPEAADAPCSDAAFEGVLILPQDPAPIVAQIGLILYSHRAFARRYQSALEELHLNRRIFRSVTSGISVSNALLPDCPLVYVNPAFEAMTGYSLEESVGRNCRFLQGEDRDQPGLTLVRQALQARREVTAVIRNYRKDGSPFWNELSISPIFNRDGQLTHFVGIQMDVTARVDFEAALRESEKLAAVGRLAASIAHEINNPLESVMNLLYLAREPDNEEWKHSYLEMADKELQRVAQITSQSLRFYRQSSRPQAVRCHDLLESVLDVYESRAVNQNISIEVRERMNESIVCLESEIRQVLSNLIRNAMDAMAGKAGRLLARSRDSTDWRSGQRGVTITIADTGSGMSRKTIDRLYTAFFTTKGIGGTGLGLWVSAEIVKRHQGRLRVRSCQRPERSWTVFQLFLPYQGWVDQGAR